MPAPNQLEEIQPSWLLDGFGVTGEQTDRDDDDDTPWDLLAWTRDDQNQEQEDFIKKCCVTCCGIIGPFLNSSDGLYYETKVTCSSCTLCSSGYLGPPVPSTNRYYTATDTYEGCINSGGCITSGTLMRSDTRNLTTCGVDETCSGEITYSGTCFFDPFTCADGNPGLTKLTSTVSDLAPC